MTGSGTATDPFVILDAVDLQAVKDDLLAYYELGANVDATVTQGWNGGAGFIPAGADQSYYNRLPESDLARAGVWATVPADGVIFDKLRLDDGDATYVESSSAGAQFTCSVFPPIDFNNKPLSQGRVIYVRVYMNAKGMHAVNYNYGKAYIVIGGVPYLYPGAQKAFQRNAYGLKYWQFDTNPATGAAWQISDLAAIDGIGMNVTSAAPTVRFTYAYLQISYDLEWSGHFDGKGHTISKLYINRPTENNVGLIGYLSSRATILYPVRGPCVVQNITLSGPTFIGDTRVGTIGEAHGTCNISNVHVISGHIECDANYAGFIAGYSFAWTNNRGKTNNCTATGTITSYAPGHGWCQRGGGITGSAEFWDFTDCGADVDITDPLGFYFGGFVNYLHNCTAYRCYGLGNIIALEDAGAFSASLHGDTYAEDCYGLGDIICSSAAFTAGGFTAAIVNTASAKNCYCIGLVVHNNPPSDGAFAGINTSTAPQVFTACFYNRSTAGIAVAVGTGSDAGITGLTTAEMQNQITPFLAAGWDIEWIYDADLANGYPFLSWQVPGSSPVWYIFPAGGGGGPPPPPGGGLFTVLTLPATEIR
jgi:hypothetical protein